jgi:biopolymer transport protein ExbD
MRAHEARRPIVEMNLIPLIDVSLILVIIFMVLTPALIQSQISVKLPKSTEGTPAVSDATIQVQISREGVILIDGEPIKPARLETELAGRMGGSSKKSVLIQADRSVPIEKVVAVLDIAKRLGVGRLGIGVTPNS